MGNDIGVAKCFVTVEYGPMTFVLMMRKRSKNDPSKHGKLELPGGGMDTNDALDELCRELREEELSGLLASRARDANPVSRTFKVSGTRHHLFQFSISFETYLTVQHAPNESMGFKLVPLDLVQDSGFASRVTPKTRKIFSKMGLWP
jgi:hypothetical protein